MSPDAIHLALATSKLGWTDDRGSADLIVKYSREVAKMDTTTQGSVTNIAIHWTYVLQVTLPDGTAVDSESAPDNFSPRRDRTEQGWLSFLHTRPEYVLTNQLLAKLHMK